MKITRKSSHKLNQFPVVIHAEEEGGYWVECPVLEGCYSQGETIEEALHNIQEAIQLCIEEYSPKELSHFVTQSVSLHLVAV